LSSGSSIIASSAQSLGFLSSGSEISFGFSSSQSCFKEPSYTFSSSISTRTVLSGFRTSLYKCDVPSPSCL